MTAAALTAIVFGWLMAAVPPDDYEAAFTYPEAAQSAEDVTVRYGEIAEDIAAVVVHDVAPAGRRHAAALLTAIAWHESRFARDVDEGPCAPDRVAKGWCDFGRAVSMFQIQNHPELEGHRRDAARLALRVAQGSFRACRNLPREARLAQYTGGTNCNNRMAQKRSAEIVVLFDRLLASK